MKKLVSALVAILGMGTLAAQDVVVKGPDGKLQLAVFAQNETKPCYSVSYNGQTMLEKSPLGMDTNIGDFTKNLKLADIPLTRSTLSTGRRVLRSPKYITVRMN